LLSSSGGADVSQTQQLLWQNSSAASSEQRSQPHVASTAVSVEEDVNFLLLGNLAAAAAAAGVASNDNIVFTFAFEHNDNELTAVTAEDKAATTKAPSFVYPAKLVGQDSTTSGKWVGKYGSYIRIPNRCV